MEDKAKYHEEEPININEIKLEMFHDSVEQIKKISFVTDEFTITWKPKLRVSRELYGMEMIKLVPMNIKNIPKKLKDMGRLINKNGCVNVLSFFHEKEFEGETYYFVTSDKTFSKWAVNMDKPEEIEIERIDKE